MMLCVLDHGNGKGSVQWRKKCNYLGVSGKSRLVEKVQSACENLVPLPWGSLQDPLLGLFGLCDLASRRHACQHS